MPRAFAPYQSGAHRLACLSLYKTLLRQCAHLGNTDVAPRNDPPVKNTLQQLVRYRFQKDRRLSSPSQIANGLKLGTVCLDLLQKCNDGSPEALEQITELAGSTAQLALSASAIKNALGYSRSRTTDGAGPSRKAVHIAANTDPASHRRHAASTPILERPIPLSDIRGGKRNVPNLIDAHGIPFLRYGKRQAVSLGRYIRQQRAWDQKKWDQRHSIEVSNYLAEQENEWDMLLQEEHNLTSELPGPLDDSEPDWTEALQDSDLKLTQQIREQSVYRADTGRKMWEIVLKERELARFEKIQRRADRKAMAKAQIKADSQLSEETETMQPAKKLDFGS